MKNRCKDWNFQTNWSETEEKYAKYVIKLWFEYWITDELICKCDYKHTQHLEWGKACPIFSKRPELWFSLYNCLTFMSTLCTKRYESWETIFLLLMFNIRSANQISIKCFKLCKTQRFISFFGQKNNLMEMLFVINPEKCFYLTFISFKMIDHGYFVSQTKS